MIKLNGKRTVRECTAEFQTTDAAGSLAFESIRVRYFSPRGHDFKDLRAEMNDKIENAPNEPVNWLAVGLSKQLHSLPDLAHPKTGKPLTHGTFDAELLDREIDLLNLQAIRDAIDEDLAPKSKPGESQTGTTRSA